MIQSLIWSSVAEFEEVCYASNMLQHVRSYKVITYNLLGINMHIYTF